MFEILLSFYVTMLLKTSIVTRAFKLNVKGSYSGLVLRINDPFNLLKLLLHVYDFLRAKFYEDKKKPPISFSIEHILCNGCFLMINIVRHAFYSFLQTDNFAISFKMAEKARQKSSSRKAKKGKDIGM